MSSFEPHRVEPAEVRRRMLAGEDLLLVSVNPESVHRRSHLEGAISLEALEDRLDTLDKRSTIVFY